MTAFYTFRMFFLTFHNSDRVPAETKAHVHESPKVITIPLMILAVGALASGAWGVLVLDIANPEVASGYFGNSIFVLDAHNPLMMIAEEGEHGMFHFLAGLPFWLAIGGIALAWIMYYRETALPAKIANISPALYRFLLNKWYWDELYEKIFIKPAQRLGTLLWKGGDLAIIDKGVIHGGIVDSIMAGAARMRAVQTGMVFHYAFAMVIGVFGFLTYLMLNG